MSTVLRIDPDMKSWPAGWELRPLGELAEITMGNSPPGESYNEKGLGVPLVNGPVEFSLGAFGVTVKTKFTTKPTKMCKEGDFLICVRGSTTGRTNVAAFDACIGRGVAAIRAKGHQWYLNHYVRTLEKRIHASGTGSTFPSISQKQLNELPIPIPTELPEQKRIAEILDRAEALRAKRRAALALLDELTQSIFLDMFGDPVTNPKGWRVGKIGDLLESANYGTSDKASEVGEFPVLRMNNISRTGEMDYTDLKYMELPVDKHDRFLVRKGDVLFNRTNSADLVGKTSVFMESEPMAYAGYLIRLRTTESNFPEYLSCFLNSAYAKRMLRGMCKSIIGMANINAKEIQAMKIALPPSSVQSEFASRISAVADIKLVHKCFLQEADELFASLQHRAFRGEL